MGMWEKLQQDQMGIWENSNTPVCGVARQGSHLRVDVIRVRTPTLESCATRG